MYEHRNSKIIAKIATFGPLLSTRRDPDALSRQPITIRHSSALERISIDLDSVEGKQKKIRDYIFHKIDTTASILILAGISRWKKNNA